MAVALQAIPIAIKECTEGNCTLYDEIAMRPRKAPEGDGQPINVQIALLSQKLDWYADGQVKWQTDISAQMAELMKAMNLDSQALATQIIHTDADRAEMHAEVSVMHRGMTAMDLRLATVEKLMADKVSASWLRLIVTDGWKTFASIGGAVWIIWQVGQAFHVFPK